MTEKFSQRPYFFKLTEIHDTDNINFTPKKFAGAVSLNRSPRPGSQGSHWLGHLPSLALLLYKKKKTSGTEVRRIWDVKIRFVGFIRFVGLNYVHIKKIRFVNVMVRSYSVGHLDSVK